MLQLLMAVPATTILYHGSVASTAVMVVVVVVNESSIWICILAYEFSESDFSFNFASYV